MNVPRVREVGDAALLLELEPVVDEQVSGCAAATARALRAAHIAGVIDVVPTIRSVAVYFNPDASDVEGIKAALLDAGHRNLSPLSGRDVEVPVHYGGADGPDLDALASWSGLRSGQVVGRHAAAVYTVLMIGFLPGFAYLGRVDSTIAMPRKPVPRLRVPAGSVGIAGEQTGVYPTASPGGWNLIGRTSVTLFDAHRTPASWLAPGDRVRFLPASGPLTPPDLACPESVMSLEGRRIVVVRPGLHTTIQDRGRYGHHADGVPVSGAMDIASHDEANAIVGNNPDAATLEATILGPEIRFEQDTVIGLAGADLDAFVDGATVATGHPLVCRSGSRLSFGERRKGARTYIAFAGGVDTLPVLGSRSTHPSAGIGPMGGRALRAGDVLPLGSARGAMLTTFDRRPRRLPAGGARVRVLPGPQDQYFSERAFDILQRCRFVVTPQSNRMGYRLAGEPVPRLDGPEMISDAAFTGGIQIPPSGDPIVLMADRQTTGGYPQIAVVITADLPTVAQLAPGDWIEFEICSIAEAGAARVGRSGVV